jgi:hypothetical protein
VCDVVFWFSQLEASQDIGGNAMNEMNRRKFLKSTGTLALFGTTADSIKQVFLSISPNSINQAFNKYWQQGFNVYNEPNPNVKDIVAHTFKDCLSNGFAPSICYENSKPMVAAAKGKVTEVAGMEDLDSFMKSLGADPVEAKGYFVKITHGANFASYYYHLKKPEVKVGQIIHRGERLGFPDERWYAPRLLFLTECATLADPDNYGIHHGFMTYWDGITDLDISEAVQNKRLETQKEIQNKIAGLYSGSKKYTLPGKRRHKDKWGPIGNFRYIEYLFKKEPQSFTSLTKDRFEDMRKEFYSNQPIILTLPFKKGLCLNCI